MVIYTVMIKLKLGLELGFQIRSSVKKDVIVKR